MAFCSNCGTRLDEGARFCASCGFEVPGDAAVQTPAAHEVEAAASSGEFVVGSWRGDATPQATQEYQPVQAMQPQYQQPAQPTQPYQQPQSAQQAQGNWEPQTTQEHQPTQATQPYRQLQEAQPYRQQPRQPGGHQPSVHYSSEQGGRQLAPKKSKLPLIVGIIVAIVIIALLALYVVPLFIWHPHDPHEDQAYSPTVTQSAASATSATSSTDSASASASSSDSGASASDASASAEAATSDSAPAASAADATPSQASPADYSTTEPPTLEDFQWLTGEAMKGNVPAGAMRIVDPSSVVGGWKVYQFGNGLERLANATIDVGQSGMAVAIDWLYVMVDATGEGHDDTSPNSTFSGAWNGGLMEVTGSGRITIAAFWEQDGHQYAVGSFTWPSGETDTITLVRP